jgi:hypothetical protein
MTEVGVLVSVDDQHMNQLPEVSRQLQAKGMQVRQLLDRVGIITGLIDSDKLDSLHTVKGVIHVKQEQELDAI